MIHVYTHGLCKLSVLKKKSCVYIATIRYNPQGNISYIALSAALIHKCNRLHIHIIYVKGRYASKIHVEGDEILVQHEADSKSIRSKQIKEDCVFNLRSFPSVF